MLRLLLTALAAAIPLTVMAQSPWGASSPTRVASGAQLPWATKVEFVQQIPTTLWHFDSSLFTVEDSAPLLPGAVSAADLPGGIVVSDPSAKMQPTVVPYPTWAPDSWGCGDGETCCKQPQCGWVRYEQLFWSIDNGRLPPLVTTAPNGTDIGTAGAVGETGTQILFGGKQYLNDHRTGYRISAGGWLTEDRVLGIEASYFSLNGASTSFTATSNEYDILASSPFINVRTGESQRVLIGFPGVVGGSTTVNYESQRLSGYDVLARVLLSHQICGRLDGLIGYRQLNYGEKLSVRKILVPDPNGPFQVVPGSQIHCDDLWQTSTNFHGLALGLNWEVCCGTWSFNARPRVTFGQGEQIVDRSGYTTIVEPGTPDVHFPGGTYNLDSNIGRRTKKAWTAVPEVDLQISRNLGDYVRIFGGYSCLYFSQVARAGNQIDPLINTDLIPPALPTTGPALPGNSIQRSGMFVQGVSLGLELRY